MITQVWDHVYVSHLMVHRHAGSMPKTWR